jgi:hypothetical protein
MTIRRGGSYPVNTRALIAADQRLVGLLARGTEDCESCLDAGQLQTPLQARPDTVIVYNQHADALALIDSLSVPEDRVFIEIRQDTGAYRDCMRCAAAIPTTKPWN